MGNSKPSYTQQESYYDRLWFKWSARILGGDEICRLDFILSNIKKIRRNMTQRPRIVDFGCGRGWITSALSKYGDAIGVDLSITAAKKLYPRLRFIQVNVATDNIDGKFDVVVSSEIIEHLTMEDQRIYIKKAAGLLNGGGFLIMTTPNRPKAEELFREVRRAQAHRQPIENWLDKDTLAELLAPDFEITYVGSRVFYPVSIRKNRYTDYLYFLVYAYLHLFKVVDPFLPSRSQGLYLTAVARKRPSPNA